MEYYSTPSTEGSAGEPVAVSPGIRVVAVQIESAQITAIIPVVTETTQTFFTKQKVAPRRDEPVASLYLYGYNAGLSYDKTT